MSATNVVLGELIARRGYAYGYELREQSFEFFRALGYSDTMVYAALEGMEKRGLVRVIERDGSRRGTPRVYYEVTGAGREHFRDWMASRPAKGPLREEIHMQLMEAEQEDLPRMLEALHEFEAQCREQLQCLMERPLRTTASRARAPGVVLVQDGLTSHLQTTMEWAQRSRRALVNQMNRTTGAGARRRP